MSAKRFLKIRREQHNASYVLLNYGARFYKISKFVLKLQKIGGFSSEERERLHYFFNSDAFYEKVFKNYLEIKGNVSNMIHTCYVSQSFWDECLKLYQEWRLNNERD